MFCIVFLVFTKDRTMTIIMQIIWRLNKGFSNYLLMNQRNMFIEVHQNHKQFSLFVQKGSLCKKNCCQYCQQKCWNLIDKYLNQKWLSCNHIFCFLWSENLSLCFTSPMFSWYISRRDLYLMTSPATALFHIRSQDFDNLMS